MKTQIFCCVIFLTSYFNIYSQDSEIPAELYLRNQSCCTIYVKIYPVSMIFNGTIDGVIVGQKLDFIANGRDLTGQNGTYYTYNNGVGVIGNVKKEYVTIPGGVTAGFNFDHNSSNYECFGSVSHGKYKILLDWSDYNFSDGDYDTVIVEYDARGSVNDMAINFYAYNNITYNATVNCNGCTGCTEWNINHSGINKYIKMWDIYNGQTPPCTNPPAIYSTKSFGSFVYDNSSYTVPLPSDGRRDCNRSGPESVHDQSQSFTDNRSGILSLNLTLQRDAATPIGTDMKDYPTYMKVETGATLTVDNSKTFTIKKDAGWPATLARHSELHLLPESTLHLNTGSILTIENSGSFVIMMGKFLVRAK